MPNSLQNESSPYLLQHANNPVNWYPWGEEALTLAKAKDMPILLSVGYSACHWCHVMEKESFENSNIAALMNKHFISIKVDREERPDIDSIYMSAVQAMTGHGGWPMTVFLTPEGKPFYGGTYFPPEERGGMASFPRVLQTMADTYKNKKEELILSANKLVAHMNQMTTDFGGVDPLSVDILHQTFQALTKQFDTKYGGLGMEPKFPQPMTYEALLRYHIRTGDPKSLEMVNLTLDNMALGGIYDQLGGGFHRYSTDMFWLIPHFEKMLYDNALLVKLYLHTYQVTGKPLYRRVVEQTLTYINAEMRSPEGGFYSAQDADSEGVEGKFFVWRPEEIEEIIGAEDADVFNEYFGVDLNGNFEGRTILSVTGQAQVIADRKGISEEGITEIIERSKTSLLKARYSRINPARDNKILTAWNGLMLGAFSEAAAAFGDDEYLEIAEQNAAFLLENMVEEGRLLRTHNNAGRGLKGYLEDYSFLISGLLSLHEHSFTPRWMEAAISLGNSMIDLFWDGEAGHFYDTGSDHETLVVRPRDVADNAIPSGSSMATDVLLRLALITGDTLFQQVASTSLRSVRQIMTNHPTAAGHWLCALDFYLSSPKEIAIVGTRGDEWTKKLVSEIHRQFIPNKVIVGREPNDQTLERLPLMKNKDTQGGRSTAYVCHDYECQVPVTQPEDLALQLRT